MTFSVVKFRYHTNEEVKEGDMVITGNRNRGVVEKVIAPGSSDSQNYQCSNGGVLIMENWQGECSYLLMTPPDGEAWEDLEFVSRGDDQKTD